MILQFIWVFHIYKLKSFLSVLLGLSIFILLYLYIFYLCIYLSMCLSVYLSVICLSDYDRGFLGPQKVPSWSIPSPRKTIILTSIIIIQFCLLGTSYNWYHTEHPLLYLVYFTHPNICEIPHVVDCSTTSFFFLPCTIPVSEYNTIIHCPVDGHFSCIHTWGLLQIKMAVNILFFLFFY